MRGKADLESAAGLGWEGSGQQEPMGSGNEVGKAFLGGERCDWRMEG